MDGSATDTVFAGSIPELYDTLMVPLIFEPYAVDMAARVAALNPARVLETAAGTGVVTRALARALPASTDIVATDLNPPMLARAEAIGTARAVHWQPADAQQLPFDAAGFDAVVCQFGVMFFPDRPGAFAEVRRVLRPGGSFLFNVWDRIETNEIADAVTQALAELYPADPPRFMARTPHGHHEHAPLAADLAKAGFVAPARFEIVSARSRAPSALAAAIAYCQGTPLRNEIATRSPEGLAAATEFCAAALTRRFGTGPIDAQIRAHVAVVRQD
ncbi:class I SAM-dependent methyltransferase [Rhizobacter sp. Root404]|uniref:class I SAM-dependent methyltransferase n=1 Tax=Rhizobacter sp. Root404 TaxID=1736528 RepID=UPI0006F9619E|nr:class I SAM-dependent methyltransferase [Rhizobacter sp. Root404]KQW40447.1 SAM-dependent methyltransferase [Rhizobacter sp. Root404]